MTTSKPALIHFDVRHRQAGANRREQFQHAVTDLIYRRIPNWITLPAVLAALVYNGSAGDWANGIQVSLTGLAVGCALMLPQQCHGRRARPGFASQKLDFVQA